MRRARDPILSLRGRRRRGASVLEMALVLPILLMLSFGVVDYGYYMYLKNTFQGAALAGVRTAIPASATNANVTSTIQSMMTAAGISSANYTITLSPTDVSTAAAGTTVTVTVSSTWGTLGTKALSSSMGGISTAKAIQGVAAMRKEAS